MDEDDDVALLKAAQRGDRSAQSRLFERHRKTIARHILRMVGNSAAMADLVQDTFIRAFMALPRFRGDAPFSTWLYTIATNSVRNWWDSKRRRQLRESEGISASLDEHEGPMEQLEGRQHLARLYAALGTLPDKLREAFVARAIEGMTLNEAAAAFGIPTSTVSYRTRRAEYALCKALGIPFTKKTD